LFSSSSVGHPIDREISGIKIVETNEEIRDEKRDSFEKSMFCNHKFDMNPHMLEEGIIIPYTKYVYEGKRKI
jgi:hypothetical protein